MTWLLVAADHSMAPVWAVLAVVALAVFGWLVSRVWKPVRNIGADFFEEPPEPRLVLPTHPDIDPPQLPAATVPALESKPASEPLACRACEAALASNGVVPLEDWASAHSWWDRHAGRARPMLRAFGVVGPTDPGRNLYESHGFCRPCAQIAQPANRAFEEGIALEALVKRANWEQQGLVDAVRRARGLETERYQLEQASLGRIDTMRRARLGE